METYNNNEENIDTFIIDDDKEPMWAKEVIFLYFYIIFII